MKYFLALTVITIQLLSNLAVAEGIVGLNSCSPMSHNPRCWQAPTKPQNQFTCPSLRYCTRISKVSFSQNGGYICEGSGSFDCTSLIEKYGNKIINLPVLVSYSQVDTCHNPGACGVNACKPFNQIGSSALSPYCR